MTKEKSTTTTTPTINSTEEQNGVENLNINIVERMNNIDKETERPHFTVLANFCSHLIGVVFINPILHLCQDGESGFFQWGGKLAPYQRPRTRDETYKGLVQTFVDYFKEIKSGKSFEEASSLLPSAPLIFGTEEDEDISSTNAIAVADGGTRLAALCEASAIVGIDTLIPLPCHIYEGFSVKEMAGRFFTAQKTRNMNINHAIHAAVINGKFDPVVSLIRNAEKRGLFGNHFVTSNQVEAKGNPRAILMGSFLEQICWGVFNRSTKKDIFALSNEVSQESVDTLAKATVIFSEVVGRKSGTLTTSHRGHCLDSVVFQCVYARLALTSPLVSEKKKNYLTEDELRYWLKSLISDNLGKSYKLYFDYCKPFCSAGKKGMATLYSYLSDDGLLVGKNEKRNSIYRPSGNIPCTFRPEMIRNGKRSTLYKPTGVRTKEGRSKVKVITTVEF